MPRHSDRMKRWESFLFIAAALRAYVGRKPLTTEIQPDWPLVIELASQKLVTPAIGHVLTVQPDVPDDIKAYFDAVIALNAQRNAILESTLCDVVKAMNRSDITPLLLKGAANLCDGLYREAAHRIIGDLDILVPADAVTAASEVLTAIGYPTVEIISPPVTRWVRMAPRAHHLPMQANLETGAGIELHYELVGLDLSHLINAKDAMARALPQDRDGLRCFVLCPTDRVMHNIVHAQMHHEGHRKRLANLRQMLDLELLIARDRDAIDWQEIQGRFASAGAAAVLCEQAALLRELFGREGPAAARGTAATLTRLRRAVTSRPTAFTPLREIAAYYWAGFCDHPLSAINLLNPVWWPQRIRTLRARYWD